MYVSSIYVTDNIYNKTYKNAIIFLIILISVLFFIGVLNDKIFNTLSKAPKTHILGKYNCIYMYIGICLVIIGIFETVLVNKTLVKEEYSNIEVYVIGRVCGISSKEKTYALTVNVDKGIKVNKDYKKEISDKNSVKFKKSDKVLAYIDKDKMNINVGDEVILSGNLNSFLRPTNLGQFNEYDYYVKQLGYSYKIYVESIERNSGKSRGIGSSIYYEIKDRLYCIRDIVNRRYFKLFDKEKAGILSAMILGEKSLIDDDIKSLYKSMGISHILAISGLHISLIGMLVFKILSKLKIHIYMVNIITIIFLICYGIMTDFSISTNRAVIMMVIMLISSILGRSYDIYTALSISGLIILIQNPLCIYNTGFLFSYGAVIGIIYVFPCIKKVIGKDKEIMRNRENILIDKLSGEYIDHNLIISIDDAIKKILDSIGETIISGFSVYIITLPIMINSYYEITMYSILINILVLGTISLLLVSSIIAVILSFLIYKIGSIIASITWGVLEIYEIIGVYMEKINNNTLIIGSLDMGLIFIYYSVIIVTVYLVNKNKKYIVLFLLCLFIFISYKDVKNSIGSIIDKTYNKNIEITMLDISQGDGICIETADNKVITIDGGSTDEKEVDKYRMVPFFKYKGIDTIDYAIISHADSDHTSGIIGIIKNNSYGIKIRSIVLPYVVHKSDKYKEIEVIANENDIKIYYIAKGNEMSIDNVRFKCIHPDYEYKCDDENGYSITLLMSYIDFNMLFTGDIGKTQEELMLYDIEKEMSKEDEIEIIKVPHHGSKSSSSMEFLQKVSPRYALISAGANNKYGHPHTETLNRYKTIGSKVYSTIDSGAISITTNGKTMGIKESKNGK